MTNEVNRSSASKSVISDRLFDMAMPILAVLAAMVVGGILLLLLGVNPFEAYGAMFKGALGNVSGLTQTLTKMTPLLLVALGICIAFRGGVINIGGEGQIIIGAIAASAVALAFPEWPRWLLLPLSLIAGALGGAFWGGIAGVLKARLNVNEILTTVMLNAIAFQLMNYLLRGPMLDPEQIEAGTNIPQSAALPEQVWLLRLVPAHLAAHRPDPCHHSGLRGLSLPLANHHRLSHSGGRAQPRSLTLCGHPGAFVSGAVDDSQRQLRRPSRSR